MLSVNQINPSDNRQSVAERTAATLAAEMARELDVPATSPLLRLLAALQPMVPVLETVPEEEHEDKQQDVAVDPTTLELEQEVLELLQHDDSPASSPSSSPTSLHLVTLAPWRTSSDTCHTASPSSPSWLSAARHLVRPYLLAESWSPASKRLATRIGLRC